MYNLNRTATKCLARWPIIVTWMSINNYDLHVSTTGKWIHFCTVLFYTCMNFHHIFSAIPVIYWAYTQMLWSHIVKVLGLEAPLFPLPSLLTLRKPCMHYLLPICRNVFHAYYKDSALPFTLSFCAPSLCRRCPWSSVMFWAKLPSLSWTLAPAPNLWGLTLRESQKASVHAEYYSPGGQNLVELSDTGQRADLGTLLNTGDHEKLPGASLNAAKCALGGCDESGEWRRRPEGRKVLAEWLLNACVRGVKHRTSLGWRRCCWCWSDQQCLQLVKGK